jgi:hypothetical protein
MLNGDIPKRVSKVYVLDEARTGMPGRVGAGLAVMRS